MPLRVVHITIGTSQTMSRFEELGTFAIKKLAALVPIRNTSI